jgi:arylmalonate decarboxylase
MGWFVPEDVLSLKLPAHAAGWRARIGVLIPFSNSATEAEFGRLAPEGVTCHAARFRFPPAGAPEGYFAGLREHLARPLEDLKLCGSNAVVLACTTASMASPLAELSAYMTAQAGVPGISAAEAVLGALRHVGARRIAIASPYVEKSNRQIADFFGRHGISVVASEGLGLNASPETFKQTSRQTPEAVFQLCRRVAVAEADAVFVACTDLGSLDAIAPLERALGRPVISAVQACFWAAAGALKLDVRRPEFGRLLAA